MYYKRKKRISILLVIAIILMSLTANFIVVADDQTRVAVISDLSGDVRISKSGGEKTLKAEKNMNLVHGDRITTGKNSWAKLSLDGDKEIKIDEKSYISLSELTYDRSKGEKTGIKLFVGKLWTSIKKKLGKDDEFNISTPNAVMGARGTKFIVSYDVVDEPSGENGDGLNAGNSNHLNSKLVVVEGVVEAIATVPITIKDDNGNTVTKQLTIAVKVEENEEVDLIVEQLEKELQELANKLQEGGAGQEPADQEAVEKMLQEQITKEDMKAMKVEKVEFEKLDAFTLQTIVEDMQGDNGGKVDENLVKNLNQLLEKKIKEKKDKQKQVTPTPKPIKIVYDGAVIKATPIPTPTNIPTNVPTAQDTPQNATIGNAVTVIQAPDTYSNGKDYSEDGQDYVVISGDVQDTDTAWNNISVKVSIKYVGNSMYLSALDGAFNSADKVFIPATSINLKQENDGVVWSIRIPRERFANGTYTVCAYADDGAKGTDSIERGFTFDRMTPSVDVSTNLEVLSPVGGQAPNSFIITFSEAITESSKINVEAAFRAGIISGLSDHLSFVWAGNDLTVSNTDTEASIGFATGKNIECKIYDLAGNSRNVHLTDYPFVLESAIALDEDGNGKLDCLKLSFNENIVSNAIPSDAISIPYTPIITDGKLSVIFNPEDRRILDIALDENAQSDINTSVQGEISINSGVILNNDGQTYLGEVNKMPIIDGAAPIVSEVEIDLEGDYKTLSIYFSEDILDANEEIIVSEKQIREVLNGLSYATSNYSEFDENYKIDQSSGVTYNNVDGEYFIEIFDLDATEIKKINNLGCSHLSLQSEVFMDSSRNFNVQTAIFSRNVSVPQGAIIDTTKPSAKSVHYVSPNTIIVEFNEPMEGSVLEIEAYYVVELYDQTPIVISDATIKENTNNRQVILTLASSIDEGTTLTINNGLPDLVENLSEKRVSTYFSGTWSQPVAP